MPLKPEFFLIFCNQRKCLKVFRLCGGRLSQNKKTCCTFSDNVYMNLFQRMNLMELSWEPFHLCKMGENVYELLNVEAPGEKLKGFTFYVFMSLLATQRRWEREVRYEKERCCSVPHKGDTWAFRQELLWGEKRRKKEKNRILWSCIT